VTTLRLASSVILARPATPGFDVFMLRRNARSAFAPSAYVFPGGTVDASDASGESVARTLGLDPPRVASQFRARIPDALPSTEVPVGARMAPALFVAALRELFEEAGVLLARGPDGGSLVPDPAEDLAEAREALRAGRISFAEMLAARGWYADAGALTLFSHWITPANEPRRYNTHFFVAIAGAGHSPVADADETHDGVWIAPSRALEAHREGSFHLVYPTVKHLERLTEVASIDALREFAASKPIVTIEPTCSPEEGFTMPPELDRAW